MINTSSITREDTVYEIKGASDAPRTVVIEQEKRPGWTFKADDMIEGSHEGGERQEFSMPRHTLRSRLAPDRYQRQTGAGQNDQRSHDKHRDKCRMQRGVEDGPR
jgi:hypothetical protein